MVDIGDFWGRLSSVHPGGKSLFSVFLGAHFTSPSKCQVSTQGLQVVVTPLALLQCSRPASCRRMATNQWAPAAGFNEYLTSFF